MAVCPSGAAFLDQPPRDKHPSHGRTLPPFHFQTLHACSSAAAPGCKDPPGPSARQPPPDALRAVRAPAAVRCRTPPGTFPPVQGRGWDKAAPKPWARRASPVPLSCAACSRSPGTAPLPTPRCLPRLADDVLAAKCQPLPATVEKIPTIASRPAPQTLASCGRTRSNGSKLSEGAFRLHMGKKFSTMRVVKPWKRLPRKVVNGPSRETLETRLDGALSNRIQLKIIDS